MSATGQDLKTSSSQPIPQWFNPDENQWEEATGTAADGGYVQSRDGANASIGAKADAAATSTGSFSVIAILKALFGALVGAVALTDRSVTGTGVAVAAAAANTARKSLLVQAPDTNSDDVWVCLVGTAVAGAANAMQIKPSSGYAWDSPGRVPSGAVSVLAQSGDTLMVWEG